MQHDGRVEVWEIHTKNISQYKLILKKFLLGFTFIQVGSNVKSKVWFNSSCYIHEKSQLQNISMAMKIR